MDVMKALDVADRINADQLPDADPDSRAWLSDVIKTLARAYRASRELASPVGWGGEENVREQS